MYRRFGCMKFIHQRAYRRFRTLPNGTPVCVRNLAIEVVRMASTTRSHTGY